MDTLWGPGQPLVYAPALTPGIQDPDHQVEVKGQRRWELGHGWRLWELGQRNNGQVHWVCELPAPMGLQR